MIDYKKKYLKIKKKYLNLKKQIIYKNDIVIHNKSKKQGIVVELHNDSLPIYYTIKFDDGSECQTIFENITKI